MRKTLIVLNLAAALLVFPAIWGASLLVRIRLEASYTELDRAQVVDQDRLREFADRNGLDFPPNDRHKVAAWLFEPSTYYWLAGVPCVLSFTLNALLIGLFWRRRPAPPSAASESAVQADQTTRPPP